MTEWKYAKTIKCQFECRPVLGWQPRAFIKKKKKQVTFFYFLKKIGFLRVAVALSRSKLEIALLRLRQRNGKIFIALASAWD